MNWKLIIQLSLFALAMGLATVFFITPTFEPLFWIGIFVLSAYLIAKRTSRPFVHGLLLGLVNCVWITAAHLLFFDQYLSGHPAEADVIKTMPAPDSPRLMLAMFGAPIGVVSGCVIGLFALIARRLMRPTRMASDRALR